MANPVIEFVAPTGMTLTATLHDMGDDSVLKTASSVTEAANRKGIYSANVSGNGLDGIYTLVAKSGTIPVAIWYGFTDNSNSTFFYGDNVGRVATYLPSELSSSIADAVWDEVSNEHTAGGTFGKLLDQLKKQLLGTEGVVTGVLTPTTLQFSTDLTAQNGTYRHQLIVFTSGALLGQSRPIDTYQQTNGTINLQEPLTQTPSPGDEFTILVQHIHPTAEIADAVWDEPYSQHTTAGTFGKLMDILRKANTTVEGQVTATVTPSATQFSTNLNYPDGAFEHAVLLWVDAADILDQNSPILTYSQTNGLITVEESFTHVPEIGDTFVIIAASHVHSVAGINQAVLNVLSTTPATVLQPVSQSNQRIDIIRGDTYNDIRKPKLRFTVSKNYAGCTITLTIRHRVTDEILLTKTGAVDSSTILSVELTGTDTAFSTLPLDEYGLHVFDLQATDGSNNRETIIVGGSAVLSLDQTR